MAFPLMLSLSKHNIDLGNSPYVKDIVTAVMIFSCALGLRLLYQSESVVDRPIRADAAKYVKAAYNLRYFGIYSLETPARDGRHPSSKTDLAPGYPLFLSLFAGKNAIDAKVLKVQAVMGALVCVCTFLLGRLAMAYPLALIAGILTSLSPHLIALDYYLLTESLFTFVMMLGLLTLAVSWKRNRYTLSMLAGIVLALSSHIRAVNILLVFWMAPVFLWRAAERASAPRPVWLKHVAILIGGFAIVTASHRIFMNQTEPPAAAIAAGARDDVKYTDLISLARRNRGAAFLPPNFYVNGQTHVMADHDDRTCHRPTETSFWENPIPYVTWNLWGRLGVMWHWDNAYNRDVYIYPMSRKGFEVNRVLKPFHRTMRALHWPLFLLSLAAPAVLFVKWRRKTLAVQQRMLMVPALVFLYVLGMLWLIWWLPRYTIPARPLSYILAAASLSWVFDLARKRWASTKGEEGGSLLL